MSIKTVENLSNISFAVAGVCLVLAVFFWFFFQISTVIGDLSGRTARKSIAKMHAANEKTGAKSYKGSKTNAERGKMTGIMPDVTDDGKPETGLLAENRADGLESEATGVLDEATGILESEKTGLLIDENATAPLDTSAHQHLARTGGKMLEMLEEVMFVHTDEVIG